MSVESISKFFSELYGHQLSSIEFIEDHWQLNFGGPCIDAPNTLTVRIHEKEIHTSNTEFTDILFKQISKTVSVVLFKAETALIIQFNDGSEISISLRIEDYSSPESIRAHGFQNNSWIEIWVE